MSPKSAARPILRLIEIHKSFAGVHALAGVSLELLPGEVHALLGENGAGKSTLVKVMTGVHQPDAGEIELDGRPVRFPSPQVARRHGIAAIYQEPTLFPDLSVAENIFAGQYPVRAASRRVDWGRMRDEARRLFDLLDVELDPDARIRDLSFADRQMVEIAKALSAQARILIMDEPTSALTLHETEELFRIVRQLKAQGTTVVFISHRLEEAFELADRVTVLRDGHWIGTHAIDEVTPQDVIRMMVGRSLETLFPKEPAEIGAPILEVEGLTQPGVFHDVSFEVRRGEIVGMAGLVGSGRTDVARAIFGITPAVYGTIRVDGKEVTIQSPMDALALGIAYVPEDRQLHGLILPMSVAQNITLTVLRRLTRAGGWIERDAEAALAEAFARQLDVRCASLAQPVRELSGGNQQKVVLAKWLAAEPRILILDEPTRGIDVGTKAEVHRLMSQLARQGMAILMISSELPEILGMSDRILVMHEGRITREFTRAEATQESIMAAAMGAALEAAESTASL